MLSEPRVSGRLRALVVERQAGSRFLLRSALQRKGYRVVAVRTRFEALDEIADGRTPDVMLLDDPDGSGGGYRLVSLPNAASEDVAVRLVGCCFGRRVAKPARVDDVMAALDDLTGAPVERS